MKAFATAQEFLKTCFLYLVVYSFCINTGGTIYNTSFEKLTSILHRIIAIQNISSVSTGTHCLISLRTWIHWQVQLLWSFYYTHSGRDKKNIHFFYYSLSCFQDVLKEPILNRAANFSGYCLKTPFVLLMNNGQVDRVRKKTVEQT